MSHLLKSVVPRPHAVVAAGHAATYVLKYAAETLNAATRLVLIAPTWRGPLPTMMDGRRPFFDRLCRLVDMPAVGPLLYRLNVNRPVIRHMVAGHVFSDRAFLDPERLRQKLTVVRPSGARHSSVRFVTGRLDPAQCRDEFLEWARRAKIPILMVYGGETPSRSRAEMDALAVLPEVKTVRLPRGKLSVHE